MYKHKINKELGITLISLVVTIIVLLLLAGISVQMLTGNNGILIRAGQSKNETEEAELIEKAKLDIMNYQISKSKVDLTEKKLDKILAQYGEVITGEGNTKVLKTSDGNLQIPISKIYNGNLKTSTISESDEVDYYGEVIDYDVDLGIDIDGNSQYDWKIFYNDGTNIYIIAEDYVKLDNGLMPEIPGRIIDNNKPYSLYWNLSERMVPSGKTGSIDIFGDDAPNGTKYIANKYLLDWKEKVTSPQTESNEPNAKMAAVLMDTDLWSYNEITEKGFTNSNLIIEQLKSDNLNELNAIGSPTMEMWVKSWNQKHGKKSDDENKVQLYYDSNYSGYFIGETEMPSSNRSVDVNLTGKTGYEEDELYFPRKSQVEGCAAYWLASPSADAKTCVAGVYFNGFVGDNGFERTWLGIRPIVRIPSDITAIWNNSTKIWNMIKK